MASVKIELHDGDNSHTVDVGSEDKPATRAIERAAQISPRTEHHTLRVEIDGVVMKANHAEIEYSTYDAVLRITT